MLMPILEDLYKNHYASPRDFPCIHIHWQGCGDSGGIEEINLLTAEGLQYIKEKDYLPPRYYHEGAEPQLKKYWHTSPRNVIGRSAYHHITYIERPSDYELDKWIYERWGLCEINDGSYAHIYIEMPLGRAWGDSYDWIQSEELNTSVSHED